MIEQFRQDIEAGLSAAQKSLPSHYFYDVRGDELFQQIMAMPEYYITEAEDEIFRNKTQEIIDALDVAESNYFEIIELGSGDGKKSKRLLRKLLDKGHDFTYQPVDISKNILDHLEKSLVTEMPDLDINTTQALYVDALAGMKDTPHKIIVMFLGSSIGNLSDDEATDFIYQLGANIKPGDLLLLGVDLKKSRNIVLPAYNDAAGITARFNLNLLERINRELGANFVPDNFSHRPEYNENEGIAYSFLVSTAEQSVYIKSLKKSFRFSEGEKIHTEISRKYDEATLKRIIAGTDFTLDRRITDSNGYFADYILKRQ
ncbi:L-histidine N(alpha)-methyltransferase [Marinimicrobium alkaliphilum]|uniref:L-histidine N(alpha)-methyltransferase n=1 Tax=Marinimicrobium alkaliphilum TaxID=2202654 RepID=UPI000DB9508C|nr:L-histidine N(alpha)-methyltransferase [Marinimicrobium alkaliphilum]